MTSRIISRKVRQERKEKGKNNHESHEKIEPQIVQISADKKRYNY